MTFCCPLSPCRRSSSRPQARVTGIAFKCPLSGPKHVGASSRDRLARLAGRQSRTIGNNPVPRPNRLGRTRRARVVRVSRSYGRKATTASETTEDGITVNMRHLFPRFASGTPHFRRVMYGGRLANASGYRSGAWYPEAGRSFACQREAPPARVVRGGRRGLERHDASVWPPRSRLGTRPWAGDCSLGGGLVVRRGAARGVRRGAARGVRRGAARGARWGAGRGVRWGAGRGVRRALGRALGGAGRRGPGRFWCRVPTAATG